MKITHAILLAIALAATFAFFDYRQGQQEIAALEEIAAPQWEAITNWPAIETDDQITPDPNRVTTVIVLDDSGSMATEMSDAHRAVISAVQSMDDSARVAVLGLNAGLILEPMFASDAKTLVNDLVTRVPADGSTPLARAVSQAYGLLSEEAARQRSFGTYRIIVTTDGEADDNEALKSSVAEVLANSPVELTTIGIGLGNRHVLKLAGHTNYLPIGDISLLESILLQVNAEQTSFEQLTSFD
ncbi:MAG: vWA domain-containing protein [Pseudomonadota bacterium]